VGGTGLGLAIVYQIVQAHEGKVFARSRPGVGTTFVLRLRRLGIGLPRPEPPAAANKSLPAAEIDMEARGAAAGERRAHG
jgi:hypothetical protein